MSRRQAQETDLDYYAGILSRGGTVTYRTKKGLRRLLHELGRRGFLVLDFGKMLRHVGGVARLSELAAVRPPRDTVVEIPGQRPFLADGVAELLWKLVEEGHRLVVLIPADIADEPAKYGLESTPHLREELFVYSDSKPPGTGTILPAKLADILDTSTLRRLMPIAALK